MKTALAAILLLSTAAQAASEDVVAPDEMVCGSDATRPDRDISLRENIAGTEKGSIGYYRFGRGSPIVLVTGYRATLSEWNAYFLAELSKTHDVIVFDNPGIGRSTSDTAIYTVDELANATAALIRTLRLRSVTVLGWSMGGMIAQRLAIDEPSLLDHLVLLASEPPGHASVPLSKDTKDALSGGSKISFADIMRVLFPADIAHKAEQCFRVDMFKPGDYKPAHVTSSVVEAQDRLIRDWERDERSLAQLQRLSVPTLELTGADDDVVDPQNALILSRTIPRSRILEVQSAGHAMMYQYPRLLARYVGAFMNE